MKIFVVEDSLLYRTEIKKYLEALGHRVSVASNGREASERLNEESVDLLVTDMNMPEMDGPELISVVRKMRGKRFLPILMMSNETQRIMRERGQAAGGTRWLPKPFDLPTLGETIQAMVR